MAVCNILAYDSGQLRNYLVCSTSLPAAVPEKLFDVDIDGEGLILSLTDSNVGVLGLSLGHRLKLLGYIDDLKSQKLKSQESTPLVSATISVVSNRENVDNSNQSQVIENNENQVIENNDHQRQFNDENVNVISILKETDEGKDKVNSFMERQEAFLEDEERITIVQLLVSRLIRNGDDIDLYPRAEKKPNLLKQFEMKEEQIPRCPDKCFLAVYLHLQLTPNIRNLRSVNKKIVNERLVVFLKENEDVIALSKCRSIHLEIRAALSMLYRIIGESNQLLDNH